VALFFFAREGQPGITEPSGKAGQCRVKTIFSAYYSTYLADCFVEYYIYTGANGIKETEQIKTLQACLVHYLYEGDFVPMHGHCQKSNPVYFWFQYVYFNIHENKVFYLFFFSTILYGNMLTR
jgi:hypothetical protein